MRFGIGLAVAALIALAAWATAGPMEEMDTAYTDTDKPTPAKVAIGMIGAVQRTIAGIESVRDECITYAPLLTDDYSELKVTLARIKVIFNAALADIEADPEACKIHEYVLR